MTEDHDVLVQIKTLLEHQSKMYAEHREQNAKEHECFEKSLSAAHRRIDWISVTAMVSVAALVVTVFIKWAAM